MKLTFLGAAGTVTGSRYLLESEGKRILVDCGLFQGLKSLRLKNREPFPVAPASIDAVILTHAHLDHSGYLPRLAREGFAGKIFCTPATRDLARILLLDSAKIMEEEAEHARRHGFSKHSPPLPLYTVEDAVACFRLFQGVAWGRSTALPGGLEFTLHKAGHILGASMVRLRHADVTVVFSGDVGRAADTMTGPPDALPECGHLVLESTYGDRKHASVNPADQLAAILERAEKQSAVVLVPSFAVGRTQSLLLYLWTLKKAGRLPGMPIYVDSPMAADVTGLYSKYSTHHLLESSLCKEAFGLARYIQSTAESKELSTRKGPMIIISASGMATGGRILHHLKTYAPDPNNFILLAGHQAEGTRGAFLARGAGSIKIHGQYVNVAAEVIRLENVSAHADGDEMVEWLKPASRKPKVYITHGEPAASEALREKLTRELAWECQVPAYEDSAELD